MSNIPDAVDDFINTKSGAIFRQAQGGGQMGGGIPGLAPQGGAQQQIRPQV